MRSRLAWWLHSKVVLEIGNREAADCEVGEPGTNDIRSPGQRSMGQCVGRLVWRDGGKSCMMRVSGLLLVLLTLSGVVRAQPSEYTLQQYGTDCATLIAKAPVFNCLDLDIVPVTVDGQTPVSYTRNMACDKPAMLPYPAKSDGQCVPYSRMKTHRDDDIQMVLLCRRMYIRPADDPRFDSIEIIMHNVKSGSTCFFISKNFGEHPDGDDGRRVPPPDEAAPPVGQIAAQDLWAGPQEVAGHGCIYCHDSDPWMRTPWSAQSGKLPANPWGFHSVDVGGPFAHWPKPLSISTRGNTCTGCHRIGSLNTCRTMEIPGFGEQPAKMLQSVGQAPHGTLGARPGTTDEAPPKVYSDWASTFPHAAWMPPGNTLPFLEWKRIYQRDIEALRRCCDDHAAPGCIVSPIESAKAWLSRLLGR